MTHSFPRAAQLTRFLESCWERDPPPLSVTPAEVEAVYSLLFAAGAAALGWWRVRSSEAKNSPAAAEMRQAYRAQTLQSALQRRHLRHIVSLLRDAGVEPIVYKGWAVARHYPEQGLRPFGDIDLIVRPEEQATAGVALRGLGPDSPYIDTGHMELDYLSHQGWEKLFARSRLVPLEDIEARILSPEDEIGLLCTHLLRHGAWRPLWLCDVGAALAVRPSDFNWDLCLGPDRKRADWIASTIGLSHHLLGANILSSPIEAISANLPHWLVKSTMRRWDTAYYLPRVPMARYLVSPSGVIQALRWRWPDPIESTIYQNGRINRLPRLPYQLGFLLRRTGAAVAGLPRALREK